MKKIVLLLTYLFLCNYPPMLHAINLIQNDGMDNVVPNPWLTEGTLHNVFDWGSSGSVFSASDGTYLRIENDYDGRWGSSMQISIYQEIILESGCDYEISFDYKIIESYKNWFNVYLGTTSPIANYDDNLIGALGNWDNTILNTDGKFSYTFHAQQTERRYFVIKVGCSSDEWSRFKVLIDNVAIEAQLLADFSITGNKIVNYADKHVAAPIGDNLSFTNNTVYSTGTTTYLWNFGDGTTGTSTDTQITHIFTTQGLYTVTLTATDGTETSTATKIVHALDPDSENQVMGGEMSSSSEQFWISEDLGTSGNYPNMTWGVQTEFSEGQALALKSTQTSNGCRFVIYQPVWLNEGIKYNFDMLIKGSALENCLMQFYILTKDDLPTSTNPDPWDAGNQDFALGWIEKFQDLNNLFSETSNIIVGDEKDIDTDLCTFTPGSGKTGIYFVAIRLASWNNASFDISIGDLSLEAEIPSADALTWDGGKSTNWKNPENWNIFAIPSDEATVTIPKVEAGKYYPILKEATIIDKITFEPGAELGGQNFLTTAANGATVKFKLSNTGRLHMLSLPIEAGLSDFQFADKTPDPGPLAFLLKFTPKKDAENNTVADWDFINKGTDADKTSLAIGEGFIAATLDKNWDWPADGYYTASISGELAASDVPVDVKFAPDGPKDEEPSHFALAGNPYMASIDFDVLAAANSGIIKNGYLVWTVAGSVEGFVGYSALGDFGMTATDPVTRYIAPLQSFFVERNDDFSGETATLQFSLSDLTTDAIPSSIGQGTLRSASFENFGKLDIIAENGTVAVKTFIANKEGAESARKLKNGCGNIPDIYTLGDDNATALGANIINTNSAISVPLGIATKTKENTRLTFSGMSSFSDVNITLIDNATDATIPLTGDSFPYDFMYTPPTNDKGGIIADESRFVIAFSPKNTTGLDGMLKESLSVYAKNNVIHIVSSSADPIRQVSVYDMQGRMLFAENNLNTSVFSVNGLQSGAADIYIVKIITEKGVKNVKVINK